MCAVENEYQILVPVNCQTLMSVIVGGKEFFNHSVGVRKTDCAVQRFSVPMEDLDRAGEYTLRYCRVIKRYAYACLKGRTVTKTFSFRSVRQSGDIRIYVLSDCHGIKQESIEAGSFFGEELDLLILNGDVASSCMTIDEALLPHDIAYGITKGSVPCIITRGNHDLRGVCSERLPELIPSCQGKTYYSVRLGRLWLLVLDCGEDKNDDHREYGGTAAFHPMRMEETEFLRALAEQPERSGICGATHRLVVSHIPVVYQDRGSCKGEQPFDIENELYDEWVDILNCEVKPELYIAGHLHRTELWQVGSEKNARKLNCPVLIAGKPFRGSDRNIIGAALTVRDDNIDIVFSDKSKTAFTVCEN